MITLCLVLKPLDAALKVQAHTWFLDNNRDNGDDDAGVESHLMESIDDCGAAIPPEDVCFCFEAFNQLARPLGCYLNPYKMRFLISTIGLSSLLAIEREYELNMAADVRKAIRLCSTEATTLEDTKTNMLYIIQQYDTTMVNDIRHAFSKRSAEETPLEDVLFPLPVVVTYGLCLLGQPEQEFFTKKMKENEVDIKKIPSVVSDRHTILRIFGQCILYNLPHLLGLGGIYCS